MEMRETDRKGASQNRQTKCCWGQFIWKRNRLSLNFRIIPLFERRVSCSIRIGIVCISLVMIVLFPADSSRQVPDARVARTLPAAPGRHPSRQPRRWQALRPAPRRAPPGLGAIA